MAVGVKKFFTIISKSYKTAAPDRFVIFGGVDWSQWAVQGNQFGQWAAKRLRVQAARGAQGLKIWKPFGLHVRDQHRSSGAGE